MRTSVRRGVVFGAPLLGYTVAMLHPTRLGFDDDPSLYIGIHLFIPVVAVLLAWMVVLLVDGIEGRAATLARFLAWPFAVVYTVFTTFSGLAYGALVWQAGDLPVAERPAASSLIHAVYGSSLESGIHLAASVAWLALVAVTVVALLGRAPIPTLVLLPVGAFLFAWTHERPWGPAGMAAILAAVVWFELRPVAARPPRSRSLTDSGGSNADTHE